MLLSPTKLPIAHPPLNLRSTFDFIFRPKKRKFKAGWNFNHDKGRHQRQTAVQLSCQARVINTLERWIPWESLWTNLFPLTVGRGSAAHIELRRDSMNEQGHDANEQIQDNDWFRRGKVSVCLHTPQPLEKSPKLRNNFPTYVLSHMKFHRNVQCKS